MGFNTTVLILNDGLSDIEKNPAQFVESIVDALHDGGSRGVGSHCNCVQVMPSQHADVFRLYASHGNLMVELSGYSRETQELVKTHPDLIRSDLGQARALLREVEALLKEAD